MSIKQTLRGIGLLVLFVFVLGSIGGCTSHVPMAGRDFRFDPNYDNIKDGQTTTTELAKIVGPLKNVRPAGELFVVEYYYKTCAVTDYGVPVIDFQRKWLERRLVVMFDKQGIVTSHKYSVDEW